MASWNSLSDLEPIIERGYRDLGYADLAGLGYRFLSSPESTLWSDHMIMSINPAGNRPDFDNDSMFTEEGTSAFVHERWLAAPVGSSKLQQQYQALFRFLGWDPLTVLQAPFSPYRYPSWGKLPAGVRDQTLDFCLSQIWRPYFATHCPTKIICVGKPQLESMIAAIPHQLVEQASVPTGWNNRACDTASLYVFDNGCRIVQIPHLSRFGIMTAPVCQEYLPRIFAAVAGD
ncbi:MAG: hypothetical protein ACX93N_06715 [Pseudohaliea sp.]